MATDAVSSVKNAYKADTSSKRLNIAHDSPQISSEAEYTQGSDHQVDSSEIRDASTQSRVETDDVNVTAEIYSMIDLPSQLQSENTQESFNPEFHDGKCIILCAYRCKGVDTSELFNPPEPELESEPEPEPELNTSSPVEQEQVECVECVQFPCMRKNMITITMGNPTCDDTCPNLIVAEGSQTDENICGRPDDQGDFVGIIRTLPVSAKKRDEELKAGTKASLTTIEELEEASEKEGSAKKEETVARETGVAKGETQEVAAGPSVVFSADTGSRKPIRSIYEAGTIISTPSATWVQRPRRQRDCRVICTRTSGSSCSDWGLNDCVVRGSRNVRPITSHGMVQCEIIRSADRPNSCQLYEGCISSSSRCFDRRSCCYESSSWIEPNEFCSMTDYSRCKGRRSFDSFRQSFMRHQPCGINNAYGCSIGPLENAAQNCSNRNNACNPHYLNLHKTYNSIGSYYPCNNGYNAGKANCCAIGNRTIHCAPSRCYYFINSWC